MPYDLHSNNLLAKIRGMALEIDCR